MDEDIATFIFPDFKAIESIRYEFPSDLISLEEVTLAGFEIYLVEQWLRERKLSTAITTYTGSEEDHITAVKMTIQTNDHNLWPSHLRSYIVELVESQHCRPKETKSGVIYVTNLSQFPSILNLIEVEKGNVKEVWELFNVNLNLKNMGCSGRSVLTLSQPTKAAEDKFRQTFKIASNVEINFAVREIVLILQTLLYYYSLFPASHCDGILCDLTEGAVQIWWNTIGSKYYEVKQKHWEGLSALSVCAIVSFTLSLKMRLELLSTNSIDVPKDILNVERFRVAIGQFQRYSAKYSSTPQPQGAQQSHSLLLSPGAASSTSDDFSYFLDQGTIDTLMVYSNHKMSTQQFKNDFNKVKKMLKNTVSDISSGRTYLNLSSSNAALPVSEYSTADFSNVETFNDLLTLEIDKMVGFVQGKRLIYLWRGKGKQANLEDISLANSIRDQLAKQRRHQEKVSHPSTSSRSGVDYLSLPPATTTQTTSSKNSDDRKSYQHSGKPSVNGSTNGLEIYDSEYLYGTEPETREISVINKYRDESPREEVSLGDQELRRLLDNNKNFEFQLSRRSSFPSIQKELSYSLVAHRQDYAYHEEDFVGNSKILSNDLRRTNSFSVLDSSILLWDYPFSPSVNKLASDYLILKEQLESHLKKGSDKLSAYITALESHYEEGEPVSYNQFSAGSWKQNRSLDSKTIDELYNKVSSKKEILELKLKDIDLLNSRLAYEVRLLTNKVKDVEDNLRQLQDFKLKKVIENLALYQRQRPGLAERLLRYQELQKSLNGGPDASAEVKNELGNKLVSSEKAQTFWMVLYLYFLAVWHEILKIFSSENKMNDTISSGPEMLQEGPEDSQQ